MSKRFEKASLGKDAEPVNPSFKAFQAQVEEQARLSALERQRAHLAAAAAATEKDKVSTSTSTSAVNKGIEELSIEPEAEAEEDRRSLEDRLLNPTPASNATIGALLARTLALQHGEIVLQLGTHNLREKTLVSILETPTPSTSATAAPISPAKATPASTSAASSEANPPPISTSAPASSIAPSSVVSTEPVPLPLVKVETILATLRSIASEITSCISLLSNPFDPISGELGPYTYKAKTEVEHSANEEGTTQRWRGRSVRVLLRRIPDGAQDLNECRVAVVGNVDAGKSSLLGVLTKGRLDDGRGRARVSLFRHKHEVESGRTSSVGMELLGFTPDGIEVVPEGAPLPGTTIGGGAPGTSPDLAPQGSFPRKQQLSWEQISSKAAKIVSFADLAGHERYLKTTLFGLTATSPDFVLLIVGANAGLIGMSKEHLSVALALSVPVVCVVTKIDMTPPNVLDQTLKQLAKVLRSPGCRKQPVFVKDVGMACELAANFVAEKACPIFLVSNVSGEGLDLLKTFLNVVPTAADGRYPVEDDLEFSISDVFSVPFVGVVVSGVILSGSVSVGQTVLLGPDSLGAFIPTVVKSCQRKRVNVLRAEAGQSVSFALKRVKRTAVRKGMVLLEKTDVPPVSVRKFEGSCLILYHNTLITPRYQAMLHVGSVRQTVQIEGIIDRPCLRTGDRATVQFKFIKHAEHIKVGDRFLFREGRTKALGIVTALLPN